MLQILSLLSVRLDPMSVPLLLAAEQLHSEVVRPCLADSLSVLVRTATAVLDDNRMVVTNSVASVAMETKHLRTHHKPSLLHQILNSVHKISLYPQIWWVVCVHMILLADKSSIRSAASSVVGAARSTRSVHLLAHVSALPKRHMTRLANACLPLLARQHHWKRRCLCSIRNSKLKRKSVFKISRMQWPRGSEL